MKELPGYIRVIAEDELTEGEIHRFDVGDDQRIVTRVNGEVYALDGICTHEYAELAEGEAEDGVLWCPLHGSGFKVGSGAVTSLPAVVPVAVYDVKTVEGEIFVSVDPDDAA